MSHIQEMTYEQNSGMPELLVPWQETYFKSQVFIRIHLNLFSYTAYNSYVSITIENVHYFIKYFKYFKILFNGSSSAQYSHN